MENKYKENPAHNKANHHTDKAPVSSSHWHRTQELVTHDKENCIEEFEEQVENKKADK